ncbi:MAG TPA: DUF1015 domain-containing protein [Anaerolinea thermolimosa]|uniref:DUF1015 domain-containing protein n=1 Tax=Anaerolinea thermolimosa TaxID=229919 RepID=A0A3D1JHW0_9CHLR|nr:DUF1015 domain-containing protein [Anaerolinea thermolimosa]GAP07084.1 hypothetical protein ATHL_01952 [Anaerolinea thermolimosa]HCE18073.1 DUF1015 domain-containing protein [Anaerolinea thermolimosa]
MRTYSDIALQVDEILIPRKDIDLKKWAVIACDQFTSQPDYWDQVRAFVGNAPSTFHLILPEVYLGSPDEPERVAAIQATMRAYLDQNLLVPHEGMILVERVVDGKTRHGVMVALDLEQYDFHKGAQTLIRATEGTIIERLPPRIRIREGASLELPHILVLIDDPARTVIEPLVARKDRLPLLYETELMLGSGTVRGFSLTSPEVETEIVTALRKLADPQAFNARYGLKSNLPVLLFAVGDGNHSLATARAIWEKIKDKVGMHHPARYALVEIENIHDPGLAFEPIHRVLFGVRDSIFSAMERFFGEPIATQPMATPSDMIAAVKTGSPEKQRIGLVSASGISVLDLPPLTNLPVGSLQTFLDTFLRDGGAERIDYVHGDEVVFDLGRQPGNLGFYLPAMAKTDLFKTVILDGALPRKTFSMGEAHEKRFYLEARRIG